jgi:predicted alpha/beta-fold hydrolase
MPLISSSYKAPSFLFSRHLETIYPVVFRKVDEVHFQRERLELSDGDFLDLDWIKQGASKLLILSHGLEGNTESKYLKGMARAATAAGYDVLAWNYRGCSGTPNRNFRFYHSGESADLHQVVLYAASMAQYSHIGLVGFSIGGNITLKYVGEQSEALPEKVKAAVAFSVPCDLQAGAYHMAEWHARFYMNRFLKSLHAKVKEKAAQYPDRIHDQGFEKIKNFLDFDQRYTAPIHGFQDAFDYWKKCSSLHYLKGIRIPSLLVSAQNDPFLPKGCYPFAEASSHPSFYLETPEHGGHCGFYQNNPNGNYWSDNRALDFLSNYL